MEQLLSKAAQETKRVMAGVQTSQFSDSTPCKDFDVKALANHMAGLAMGTERAAKKLERMAPPDPMPDIVGDTPGTVYAGLADAAVEAWSAPGALEGNTQFGPSEIPAQMAAAVTLMEVSVHGWDLAAATGQSYTMAPDVAAAVHETVKQLATPDSRESGVFAAEIQPSDGASEQDQLLALSGRDPAWSA